MKTWVIASLILLSFQSQAMELYVVNTKPLLAHPELATEFFTLQEKFDRGPIHFDEHQRRLDLLGEALNRQNDWWDGYWLYGSESFVIASTFSQEKDYPIARSYLLDGIKKQDHCLQQQPKSLLCRFFRASLQAKLASIEGVFASLKYGKEIHDAFFEVTSTNINLQLRPNVSLQGAAHYGLGLFYRLVPDMALIDWIWGIRGNLEQSIRMHRKALEFDQKNPCSLLMLAVAQLCVYHGEKEHPQYRSAFQNLKTAQSLKAIDTPQEICIQETSRIMESPDRTCGYTQAKYQEDDEEI